MANVEFGTAKTVIILSIVAACFAVLLPKIFYPMFMASPSRKPDTSNLNGCCDVIFETDINAIKIMNDLCGSILNRHSDFNPKLSQSFQQGTLSKEVINTCRTEVMNMCGIDIAEFLNKKEKLGHSYKQMLDEIRSFNISICLRHNFGINPGLLGTPRRMRIWSPSTPRHLRQERPLNFRPEIIHPALREKGRAIPQSHVVPQVTENQRPRRMPIPMPGMRPTMGGPGHVVPPPKTGGSINVIMPIYTIGIILFFTYTVMKIFTKKTSGDNDYKNFHSDPEFRRVVFSEDYSNGCAARIGEDGMRGRGSRGSGLRKSPSQESTRLGWKERDTIMTAFTGLLAEVNQQLDREGETQNQYSTELKGKKNLEETCTEEIASVKKVSDLSKQVDITKKEGKNGHVGVYQEEAAEDTKPKVKVMGLELMAECEGGQKWSRPATPNLGVGGISRSATPIPPSYSPEPQNIFLEGALPQQSQLLVTDSKTQALTLPDGDEPEPPVILSSKMTLSLISLDTPMPEEQVRHEQLLSAEIKSECEENLGTTDSTLLDVDSVREQFCASSVVKPNLMKELIEETGQNEYESLGEQEGMTSVSQQVNEISEEKPSLDYTTATSERAEAGFELELEDTAADVSNLDGLDITDDQEDLQNENVQLCNGNSKEADEPHEQEPLESGDSQQQS